MNTKKLIDRLRRNSVINEITVFTSEEANAVYQYIDELENRIETKQLKFMAICDQTYEMVKVNRELRRQLDSLGTLTDAPTDGQANASADEEAWRSC